MYEGILCSKIRKKSIRKLLVAAGFAIPLFFFLYLLIATQETACYVFIGIFFFIFAGFFISAVRPLIDMSNYAYIKSLPKGVDIADVEKQYADAQPGDFYPFTNRITFCLAKNWIIVETAWNLEIYNADYCLWAYQETVNTKKGLFGETETDYNVKIYFKKNFTDKKGCGDIVKKLLAGISANYPWVITGYSNELHKTWCNNKEKFLEYASAKKLQVNHNDIEM